MLILILILIQILIISILIVDTITNINTIRIQLRPLKHFLFRTLKLFGGDRLKRVQHY